MVLRIENQCLSVFFRRWMCSGQTPRPPVACCYSSQHTKSSTLKSSPLRYCPCLLFFAFYVCTYTPSQIRRTLARHCAHSHRLERTNLNYRIGIMMKWAPQYPRMVFVSVDQSMANACGPQKVHHFPPLALPPPYHSIVSNYDQFCP
jgi:hypothetical protein